jgi:anti-repressor protein
VLPAIRKDGGYIASNAEDTPEQIMARAVLIAQKTIEKQQAQINEMKPKAFFAEAVSASSSSILVGELAKLLRQNGFETGQKRLFDLLRNEGYLMKSVSSKNMPTQKSMEMGLFEIKETTIATPNGSVRVTKTPKVTGKGQVYFVNRYCAK